MDPFCPCCDCGCDDGCDCGPDGTDADEVERAAEPLPASGPAVSLRTTIGVSNSSSLSALARSPPVDKDVVVVGNMSVRHDTKGDAQSLRTVSRAIIRMIVMSLHKMKPMSSARVAWRESVANVLILARSKFRV